MIINAHEHVFIISLLIFCKDVLSVACLTVAFFQRAQKVCGSLHFNFYALGKEIT